MKPYKVSEVNKYINKTLSTDFILSDIKVEGEVSNFVHHYSGHMYFSLKDEDSKLKSVMFKWDNKDLDIDLKDGMKIVAEGNISVYEKEGIYQLYVKSVEESGLGELYKEFEKLKKKLEGEGLFSDENKLPIPKLPKKIGVVTSATGAAIKDIITVIKRRFPPTEILLYPALVQGQGAAKEIIEGLLYLDNREDVDLIIFGRGGGATEELFAFNDEELARVIYGLKKPSISAVGHEIDFTIGDFVADLRAATPSAAAELAVPDLLVYKKELNTMFDSIKSITLDKIEDIKRNLVFSKRELVYYSPEKQLLNQFQTNDQLYKDYNAKLLTLINDRKQELLRLKNRLDLVNPLLAMEKGYGIITDSEGGIIKSVEDINIGDLINIILKDGKIKTSVIELEKGEIQWK